MQKGAITRGALWVLVSAIVNFAMPDTAFAQDDAGAGEADLLVSPPEDDFELTAAQRARMQRFLPHALARLDRREPVHIISLGDSVTRYVSHDEHEGDTHLAYEGVFAGELAKLFFYTGGVRDIQPAKGQPAKLDTSAGPEITLENMGLGGRVSMHALGRATTDAFVNRPSIMTIGYGINDAYANIALQEYLRAYEESAALAPTNGCDVIFLGPSTILGSESDLTSQARTLRYSSALESLAKRLGIFYFDLGTITTSGPGVDPAMGDVEALTTYNAELTKRYHTHSAGKIDMLHPSPQGQRAMGMALYNTLLEEPTPNYRIGGFATLDGDGGFSLEFKVKNLGAEDVDGRVFLPPFAGFKATQLAIPFKARAGKGAILTATYRQEDGRSSYQLESSEALLRVPLLIADEKQSHATTLIAAIGPVAPVWQTGAHDGLSDAVQGEFTLVVPARAEAASGDFTITWLGQTTHGTYHSGTPIRFSIPLPTSAVWRAKGPLVLELKRAGKTFKFTRHMEISRNIGLGEAVPMARADRYREVREHREGEGSPRSDVTFRASADADGLTLVHEIATPMQSLGGKAPFLLEVQIDARQYGKRRTFGFADFIRFTPTDDGGIRTSSLRPAVFGNGYGKKLDKRVIKTTRQALPGGGEKLSITIPRSYFYLHEWALGNGNSLLGINTRVFVQGPTATADRPYGPDSEYLLLDPGMSRFNTQSLGVLELSKKPTKRWSSRLY